MKLVTVKRFVTEFAIISNMKNLFSIRIKELREAAGLNQLELSKLFNVTKQTVSAWEKGLQQTNFDMLINIAKHFNVTVDFLLGLED